MLASLKMLMIIYSLTIIIFICDKIYNFSEHLYTWFDIATTIFVKCFGANFEYFQKFWSIDKNSIFNKKCKIWNNIV